jgi:Fic family protein
MHRIRLPEDALNRAGRMNAKLAEWQKQVAGESTNAPLRVVELLASNPFITAKGAADKLGVALTTAPRAIELLECGGIVQTVSGAKRNRGYCAQALLDTLEEPTHLTPLDNR